MLLDSLSTISGVVTGITIILGLVYIVLADEQRKETDKQAQGERYSPALAIDDELLSLTSSIYPYPEYSYFPVLAFSTEPQALVQSTQQAPHTSVLPLYRERQEAIQPA